MDGATSLDALLPSPQGPQSASPLMPTAGVMSPGHAPMAPTFKPSLPAMRFIFSNTTLYLSFFLAAAAISMSAPRNILLQYVPNAYTSGGVVSYTGAGILGAAAVIVAHLLNQFLSGFLG